MLCSNAQITVLIHYLNYLSVLLQSTVVGDTSTVSPAPHGTRGQPSCTASGPGSPGHTLVSTGKARGPGAPPATGAIPRHKRGPGSRCQRRAGTAGTAAAARPSPAAPWGGSAARPRVAGETPRRHGDQHAARPGRCPPGLTRKNGKNHLSCHESRQRHRSVPVLLRALLQPAHHTFPMRAWASMGHEPHPGPHWHRGESSSAKPQRLLSCLADGSHRLLSLC